MQFNSSWVAVASSKIRTPTPIVLVGFMAAGKSTVGALLAEHLGSSFVDTDDAIEAAFDMPIAEIFRLKGEAQFREAERDLISRLIERPHQVIAVGGGAFVDDRTRDLLNRSATTVWLDTPLELIVSRLERSRSRPLASARSKGELVELWEERGKFYAEAHVRIAISGCEPQRTVERILSELSVD